MLVIYSTCIQSDGTLRCVSREEMMERAGMSRDMVDRGIKSLKNKGIIEPCEVLKSGAMVADTSHVGHVARYRIAADVWASIIQHSTSDEASKQEVKTHE